MPNNDVMHTPGPWDIETVDNDGDYGDGGPDSRSGYKSFAVTDADGRILFDTLNRDWRLTEVHDESDDERRYAWDEPARRDIELAKEAPAMHLALALICGGVASIATVTPPGFASFSEFVFDGTHYALSDGRSWTDVINLAGWTRCRAALAATGGSA